MTKGRDTPRLDADGFSVLLGLMEADECRRFVGEVDIIASSAAEPLMSRTGNELHPLRWNSRLAASVLGCSRRLDRIRAASGARDLRFISAYVSLKRPASPAMGWHQDWWCWDHPVSRRAAAAQIAVICYLGDADRRSGALRVLPGSHLERTDLHGVIPEAHSAEARALPADHPAMLTVTGEQAVEVAAGDAVVLDYRVLHGTFPNDAPVRRDAVLMSFVPDWSGLPEDVKDHLKQQPALPDRSERAAPAKELEGLFPPLGGSGRSLPVNRVPIFEARS